MSDRIFDKLFSSPMLFSKQKLMNLRRPVAAVSSGKECEHDNNKTHTMYTSRATTTAAARRVRHQSMNERAEQSRAEQSSCQKAQSVNKIPAKLPLNPYYKQRESARLRDWENFTRTRWINETEQRKRGRCRERSKWAALLNDFSMCQFIILIFFSISFSIINCTAKCLQSNKKNLDLYTRYAAIDCAIWRQKKNSGNIFRHAYRESSV